MHGQLEPLRTGRSVWARQRLARRAGMPQASTVTPGQPRVRGQVRSYLELLTFPTIRVQTARRASDRTRRHRTVEREENGGTATRWTRGRSFAVPGRGCR